MRYSKALLVAFAASVLCVSFAPISIGGDYQKGSRVVALKDSQLRIETKSTGIVHKGDKFTVLNAKEQWLWVRSGESLGWIERTSVIDATLFDHYRRQPDGFIDQVFGDVRTKVNGVTFEIQGGGLNTSIEMNGGKMLVKARAFQLVIEKTGDGSCDLSVAETAYGTLQTGDHVFVNKSAEVFVNGELRKASDL
jgi:hypothetical protein